MNYLDLRAGERIEIELAYQRALREVRNIFARDLAGYRDGDDKDEGKISDATVSTVLEIFDGLFEIGFMEHCEPPDGFVEFLDALDRVGWDLVRRRPSLPARDRSTKTRKPRVRKLA